MSRKASGEHPLALWRPSLGEGEERACERVLRSGCLTAGPEVESFERELCVATGFRHAIAVSSGSAALLLALYTSGVGPGDEVIVPSYTFVATANAVALRGASVVPADVEQDSYNICPRSAGALLSERTVLIVPVHQFGRLANTAALRALAGRAGLLEDAACALGAVDGSVAQTACFSFHPRKVITTGEGGMIATAKAGLAERLRRLRAHGLKDGLAQEAGYNFRMSEQAAAMGRVQLRKLPELIAKRRRVAEWYASGLSGIDWLILPEIDGKTVFQSYVVRLRAEAPLSRERLLSRLTSRGIGCQAGVVPVHLHPAYRDSARCELPVAEMLGRSSFFLPMHTQLTKADIDRVCRALRELS
ncbi:MAG TPA: DegT/DnrJ/EryC1/StrS family aminotransferase [Myxococcota bacterium]|nr:DegT/DnrJ/EryC1/StrS family aminotransferase [Myxococcota bacterium]